MSVRRHLTMAMAAQPGRAPAPRSLAKHARVQPNAGGSTASRMTAAGVERAHKSAIDDRGLIARHRRRYYRETRCVASSGRRRVFMPRPLALCVSIVRFAHRWAIVVAQRKPMQNIRSNEPQPDRALWVDRFRATRSASEALASGLTAEDQTIQSMPDASPTKWHLAHTTWFFETFLLMPLMRDYQPFAPAFQYLFNSYYEAVGPRHPRPQRGLLSRPSVAEVGAYRTAVTAQVSALIEHAERALWERLLPILILGLNHEEQHQELILMDIKHTFSVNPLDPVYRARPTVVGTGEANPLRWIDFAGGLVEIGAADGLFFDNEGPRHKLWLEPYRLATRLVTCGDYLDFIGDGGYRRPELWLSDGWQTVLAQNWRAPLYWREEGSTWSLFTLAGRRSIDRAEPVVHVSYYEADALARWARRRLPREGEWENAAQSVPLTGNLLDSGRLHPAA